MRNPLNDLIHSGESVQDGYDAHNRGTDAHGHMLPSGGKVAVTQLTIKEIQERQASPHSDPDHLGAVGAYQLMKRTMNEAVTTLRLDVHQKFTAAVQKHIVTDYLIASKHPEVHGYVAGAPGATLKDAQLGLAKEWASLGDPNHQGTVSHYGLPNHATILPERVAGALNQMRDSYQAELRRHASPEQAWKTVTATDGAQTPVLHAPAASHQAHHADHAATRRLWVASTAPAAVETLRVGDHGHAVSRLQTELNQHGHTLHVDGKFGAATERAVTQFQHEHRLVIDGIVGVHTQHALAVQAVRAQAQPPHLAPARQNHP